ncbi:MAG: endonuclease/exonuclease/phosphatase family protein [Kiritimatiellae bacterium]|nr:endonuclease/exonuclease/phosphatase family protein [Kiritimatiellia bacterium]
MTYTGAGTQIIAFKRGNGWTPNVTLNWGNNTQPRFDFWDNWDGRGAVAQIESDAERSNVDLVFTPDAGYGVRINSFELDAWNDGGEMIVEWSVLSGMDLLASGTTYLSNSGERKIVQTGLNNQDISLGQPVTLGFKPRSGKVNYLAMDNLDFDQFNDPALMKLSIMSFNVWTVEDTGAGVNKIVDIVRQSGADIVGFQELSNASAVAGALGWFVLSQSSSDVQIISRYPIIAESSASIPYKGAKIRVAAETDVWLFNCHLPAYPYQPEDLRDGKLARNEAAVIAAALAARGSQVAALTNEIIASGVINHYPTFVTGDFNEPSHLDWTQATADATPRDYDLAVNWPASSSMVAAGFTDSFRSVRGNPVSVPGYTWTPGAPPPQIDADEVLDRIDFVYAAGPQLSLQSSYNIGYTVTNTHTDIAIADYPSDHRAVLSTFYIPLLGKPLKESGQTTLTFEGKDRNKRMPIHWGSGVSTNEPGIKTVKEGTPHITLTWSTSADCKWEFYNDDEWSGAQMDNFEEGKTFDLLFTPADGYGVRVSSFVFDDYVNWYGGNRFNWALLEDNANGTVITSQTGVLTKDGEKKLISTGMFTPHYGPVLLRITGGVDPDSVSNSDQALDNIVFSESQVPCLRTLILLK